MKSPVSKSARDRLRERGEPIVTDYGLFQLLWDIYHRPEHYPYKIVAKVRNPGYLQFKRLVDDLTNDRDLRPDPDFEIGRSGTLTSVFRISSNPDRSAEDIICLADPFCAISYLSAMSKFGFSDRSPSNLMVVTFGTFLWEQKAQEKVQEDFEFKDLYYPQFFKSLSYPPIPGSLRGRSLEVHKVDTIEYFDQEYDETSYSRYVGIGYLFRQMFDRPDLCGGWHHIIDVWKEHAPLFLDQIITSIDKSEKSITKVRAGYLLNECAGIEDERVLKWVQYAQRGGSRKLDSSSPYHSNFSEKWMLSINV